MKGILADKNVEGHVTALVRILQVPVFTLADAERVVNDRGYAERVAEALLEYRFRINDLRGTGRLHLR